MARERLLWIPVTLLLAAAQAQGAAGPRSTRELSDLTLEELANIEVTSVSKRPQRLADAPASVFIITGEDIRRSGVSSLPEALRLAPNLEVARSDASHYAISARGFASTSANKLLVLIDGRTVYTPLFSGVFWDVQDVMLADIERIEVVSGPGASVWGTNAVVGVINVITRSAADTQGGIVRLSAGNLEAGVGVRHGGALGATGAYRVYGRFTDREATVRADGTAQRDSARKAQAGFRADWSEAGDLLTLQGDAYKGEAEQAAPGDRKVSGGNVLARWSRRLSADSSLQLQAFFEQTDREYPGSFGERLEVADVEFQHGWQPFAAHAVTWGGGYRSARDHVRNSAALAFLPADKRLAWSNLFVQDEIALGARLHVVVGARLEHNVYSGNEFLPTARIAWKPEEGRLCWASLARAVRSPSRIDRDLFAPGQPPFTILAGGPDFRSEISNVVELGYRAQPSAVLSYSITGFHHRHDHLRNVEPVPGGPVIANLLEGSTSGVEGWANVQVASGWRLGAGAVGLRKRLRYKEESRLAGTRVTAEGNDPSSQWMIRSSQDLAPGHELDIHVRRVGALPSPSVPAYVAVDLRYGWRIGRGLEVSMLAQNLFDARHPEFGSPATRSEIERSFQVKARWQF